MFFFVVGSAIFALLFILLGYFLGNHEAKKVYRELLCYRQAVIVRLTDDNKALSACNRTLRDKLPQNGQYIIHGATRPTVAALTRNMQKAVTVKEYNYYVRLLRSAGSELMRTPLRTEHVHSDYQRKQQDVPAFWP